MKPGAKQEVTGASATDPYRRPTVRARCTSCQISFKCFLTFFGQVVRCPVCERQLRHPATKKTTNHSVAVADGGVADSDNGESTAAFTTVDGGTPELPKEMVLETSGEENITPPAAAVGKLREGFKLKACEAAVQRASAVGGGADPPSEITCTEEHPSQLVATNQTQPKQPLPPDENVPPGQEFRSGITNTTVHNGDTTTASHDDHAPTTTSIPNDEEEEGEPPAASCLLDVPDPDFYDFDSNRSPTSSFHPGDIWAVYDDAESMPRWYVKLRSVLSHDPFTVDMAFLTSRPASKFGGASGAVEKWVSEGFTKSCGDFAVGRYEVRRDCLPMFSHRARWEKVAQPHIGRRGWAGFIRILPRMGDVWALYRHWAPGWDSHTPDEVVRRYDLVEVVKEDYGGVDRQLGGVVVHPVVKVDGYTAVYRRHGELEGGSTRVLRGEEMLRFSHRVPARLLTGEEGDGAPVGFWQLDPAAIPTHVLMDQGTPEPSQTKNPIDESAAQGPLLNELPNQDPVEDPFASDSGLVDQRVVASEPAPHEPTPATADNPAPTQLPSLNQLVPGNAALDEPAVPAPQDSSLNNLAASDVSVDEHADADASLHDLAATTVSSFNEPAVDNASLEEDHLLKKLGADHFPNNPTLESAAIDDLLAAATDQVVDELAVDDLVPDEPPHEVSALDDNLASHVLPPKGSTLDQPADQIDPVVDLPIEEATFLSDLAAGKSSLDNTDVGDDQPAADDLPTDDPAHQGSVLDDLAADDLVNGESQVKDPVEPTATVPSCSHLTDVTDKLEFANVEPAADNLTPVESALKDSAVTPEEPTLVNPALADLAVKDPFVDQQQTTPDDPEVGEEAANTAPDDPKAGEDASVEAPAFENDSTVNEPAEEPSSAEMEQLLSSCPKEKLAALLLHSCPLEKLVALFLHSCPMENLTTLIQDMASTNPDVLNRVSAMAANPSYNKVSSTENHVRTAGPESPMLRKRLRNSNGTAPIPAPPAKVAHVGLLDTPPSKSRKVLPISEAAAKLNKFLVQTCGIQKSSD